MGSIFTTDLNHCFICGRPEAQIHHMMNGANKRKSEKYGLIIPLCMNHHTGAEGVHTNPEKMLEMRRMAQKGFEERCQEPDARAEWLREFGKSYL